MYKILIVDDEKIERDGIKLLIKMNEFPLDVAEAGNGETALEYLKTNPVNILFTDIKMPFMDGLQLADMAKKICPNIKIVIFSAYGEFDYAQKAIRTKVVNYILKPIDMAEFKQMMENVLRICSDEEKEEEKSKEITEGYLKGLEYEKCKLLLDIVSGTRFDNIPAKSRETLQKAFNGRNIVLMLIDLKESFFGFSNDDFKEILKTLLKTDHEYVNINEKQSLVFLKYGDNIPERSSIENLGQAIQKGIQDKYGFKSNIIFTNPACSIEDVNIEYSKIEKVLDIKFFYDEGTIIFASDTELRIPISNTTIERILKDITNAIDTNDFIYAAEGVGYLFESFKMNASLSSVYVKFICGDIIRKVYEKLNSKASVDFMSELEKIFANDNMNELKDDIIRAISCAEQHEDTGKAVMRKVTDIIKKEYMNDISLEYIADKVFLTPSYLSYLFKKQSSQSMVKYITFYRLNIAKELLKNTNMKIVDVGKKVGYSNLSYFCMIFKNNFGVSPAIFREESEVK